MRLYYEALSKIPKRFIHSKTQVVTYTEDRIVLCNPNFEPMIYVRNENKWRKIKPDLKPFLENENILGVAGEVGFNPKDWKITIRTTENK